jgi:hypothetical protein
MSASEKTVRRSTVDSRRRLRKTWYVARINRTFTMQETSEQAQARFAEEIGSVLHRAGGFRLYMRQPGHLAYSDGIRDPLAFAGADGVEYSLLRRMLAHRIKVDFRREGTRTKVTVEDRARGSRAVMKMLGQPGQWPEAKDRAD